MPRIRATADPSVRENKKKASSHLQGGETIVLREGNRKDVPSEMRNRFVRLFVCLFVVSRCERLQSIGVAFRPFFRERMVKKLRVKLNNCLRTHPLLGRGGEFEKGDEK